MSQKNVRKVPPDPPRTAEDWAQLVVEKVSNNEGPKDGSNNEEAEEVVSQLLNDDDDVELDIDTVAQEPEEDVEVLDSEPEEELSDAEILEEAVMADPDSNTEADVAEEAASSESVSGDLEKVTAERDQYLDASRRVQAEFENYRKQVGKRESEARARANESLVTEILPVLDACDSALAAGADDVQPIYTTLVDALKKQGLERIEPKGEVFDPEVHEAVMHKDSSEASEPTVAEVLRAGYSWKGRVIRPAMVHVEG